MTLKLALSAFAGVLLGAWVANTFRDDSAARAWEQRVVRYEQDSVAYREHLTAAEQEIARVTALYQAAVALRIRAETVADGAHRDAQRAKHRADSLVTRLGTIVPGTGATADSLRLLQTAYDARTEQAEHAEAEAGSLRQALASQIEATAKLQLAYDREREAHDSTKTRLAIADDLLRDRVRPERCKVLFLPCPSRTTTFAAGAILGVIGVLTVR